MSFSIVIGLILLLLVNLLGGGVSLLGLSNTWVFLILLLCAVFLHYLQQAFGWGRVPNEMMVAGMLC